MFSSQRGSESVLLRRTPARAGALRTTVTVGSIRTNVAVAATPVTIMG
jgi:hypothetical protein